MRLTLRRLGIVCRKPLSQRSACPAEQHADVIDRQPELLGDFLVTEFFKAGQAEHLSLLRVQFRDGVAQTLGQFTRRRGLDRRQARRSVPPASGNVVNRSVSRRLPAQRLDGPRHASRRKNGDQFLMMSVRDASRAERNVC